MRDSPLHRRPGLVLPRTTRRQSFRAILAAAGGYLGTAGLFRAMGHRRGSRGDAPEGDMASLPDAAVLPMAKEILLAAEREPAAAKARHPLIRLLIAALETPSAENDLDAARAVLLLARRKWLTPDIHTMVATARGMPIVQAALQRSLAGSGEGSR